MQRKFVQFSFNQGCQGQKTTKKYPSYLTNIALLKTSKTAKSEKVWSEHSGYKAWQNILMKPRTHVYLRHWRFCLLKICESYHVIAVDQKKGPNRIQIRQIIEYEKWKWKWIEQKCPFTTPLDASLRFRWAKSLDMKPLHSCVILFGSLSTTWRQIISICWPHINHALSQFLAPPIHS